MVNWHLSKRKWLLLIIVAVLAVVLTLAAFQVSRFIEGMYPQVAVYPDDSNLSIRGVISSIGENHKAEGLNAYHTFRLYVRVNISEVVWLKDDLANLIADYDFANKSLSVGNIIGIGYDNLDNPKLMVGQTIECKGRYVSHTDSPYSFIITVAPSISESYLKTANSTE